jgi:hypothetical protein
VAYEVKFAASVKRQLQDDLGSGKPVGGANASLS